jgi:hypothetical protein
LILAVWREKSRICEAAFLEQQDRDAEPRRLRRILIVSNIPLLTSECFICATPEKKARAAKFAPLINRWLSEKFAEELV